MPTTYTHYRFGKDVLCMLPGPLAASIETNREVFDIGLHGPDILFYYRLFIPNHVTKTGYRLHKLPAEQFFARAARVMEEKGNILDQGAARAYLYGVICHFALDSQCHPYVEKIIQAGRISHSEIEMELDRFLLTEDGFEPVSRPLCGHIHPSRENARVIAPFYKGVTEAQIQKSLSWMLWVHRMLLAPGRGKRACLFLVMRFVGMYQKGSKLVMSRQPSPACEKYVRLLFRQYKQAVPAAVELILNFQNVLFEHEKLSPRFHETFGAGEHWEDLSV